MREVLGDIWDYYETGAWIVVTTNGSVRKDGACVMGRGIALQAAQRFPELPYELGRLIKKGNKLFWFRELRIVIFPVKHAWWERASLELIEQSARQLREFVDSGEVTTPIYLVRPGCGNGRLAWAVVKPVLEKCLDSRFVVVEKEDD